MAVLVSAGAITFLFAAWLVRCREVGELLRR